MDTIKSISFIALLIAGSSMAYAQECDVSTLLFSQDFSSYEDTTMLYTVENVMVDFNNVSARTSAEIRGLSEEWPQKNYVVNGELKAQYLMNDASGRSGGFLFDSSFEGVEEAVLEYKIKFDSNFVWATGGKLPGLGGAINTTHGLPAGCTQNNDVIENAFSCRLMWRSNRAHTQPPYIIVYPYLPNRDTNCGGNLPFIRDIKKDVWYTIKQYIKLNTPGMSNGILQMYVDDELLLEESNILYRLAGKDDVKINSLVMHTYRGGRRDDTVWHSPTTDYIYFDDFKIWTNCTFELSENQIPSVSFLTPKSDTTVTLGYRLYMEALAIDNDGMVDNVQLFINGEAKRQEKVPPYTWGHDNSPDPEELNNLPVGEHEIKVVVTDNRGGTGEATFTLTVEQASSTSQEDIADAISVFPIPFESHLMVESSFSNITALTLLDISGKRVKNFENISTDRFRLDTANLQEGVYIMAVRNAENEVHHIKVMK